MHGACVTQSFADAEEVAVDAGDRRFGRLVEDVTDRFGGEVRSVVAELRPRDRGEGLFEGAADACPEPELEVDLERDAASQDLHRSGVRLVGPQRVERSVSPQISQEVRWDEHVAVRGRRRSREEVVGEVSGGRWAVEFLERSRYQ